MIDINKINKMSLFRSKQMKYYSLVIPRESAWVVMD